MRRKLQKGQLTLEAILAVAIFVIFSAGAIGVVLQGLDANRTGNETAIAATYASEGLEAARSMRNQNYNSLISTTSAGLTRTALNVWIFSGTSNTFSKYTRKMAVNAVYRDASGNIVSTGGALDPDTKKITSTVTWNISPQRSNSIVLSTYLTNWRATPPSCAAYCSGLASYTTGTCRSAPASCAAFGEVYESGGNTYCAGTPPNSYCCCK